MTVKEHKTLCRYRVERYSKYLTLLSLLMLIAIGVPLDIFTVKSAIYTGIMTAIWLLAPDAYAYVLENKYKIKHNRVTYR